MKHSSQQENLLTAASVSLRPGSVRFQDPKLLLKPRSLQIDLSFLHRTHPTGIQGQSQVILIHQMCISMEPASGRSVHRKMFRNFERERINNTLAFLWQVVSRSLSANIRSCCVRLAWVWVGASHTEAYFTTLCLTSYPTLCLHMTL